MINISKRSITLLTLFLSSSLLTGCSDNGIIEDSNMEPINNLTYAENTAGTENNGQESGKQDQKPLTVLKDDNDNEYILIKNADGTETVKFTNGEEITFNRQNDGSIDVISGAGNLLVGILTGYFLFHGLNPPTGNYVSASNRYVSTSRPTRLSANERSQRLEQYIKKEERRNGGGYVYSGTSRQSTSNALGESASPKVGSSSSAPKSGFGSVGARSAAS